MGYANLFIIVNKLKMKISYWWITNQNIRCQNYILFVFSIEKGPNNIKKIIDAKRKEKKKTKAKKLNYENLLKRILII